MTGTHGMNEPPLATARLRLRQRLPADLEPSLAMDLDPEVHRYIFDSAPHPERHRAELRQRIADGWPRQGGLWVVEWAHRPGFLGWCGIFPLEDSGWMEIGYRYVRAAWGQGIATEAARTVLEHGFRALSIDPIVGVADPDNLASRRVLRKIGLQYQGMAQHYGKRLPFYRLTRTAYEERRDAIRQS